MNKHTGTPVQMHKINPIFTKLLHSIAAKVDAKPASKPPSLPGSPKRKLSNEDVKKILAMRPMEAAQTFGISIGYARSIIAGGARPLTSRGSLGKAGGK